MSEERLQKLLARSGIASRRKAEELITEGRVTVNGAVAELGQKVDPERDAIKVDGKRVHAPSAEHHVYLLLNKPRGVVSTVSDPEGRPTVLELVPPALQKALVPVGRLDFLTEGLILLTNDGDFAHRVAHPSHGCVKTYEVKVKGRPDEKGLERLRRGIVLEGRRTAPLRIAARPSRPGPRTGENSWWMVELSEGRTRQIREMFFRIGHPVQRLRRVAIGALTDPNLPLGQIRELTADEVERLRQPAGGRKGGAAGAGLITGRRRPLERGPGWAKPAASTGRGPKARGPKAGGSKAGGPKAGGPKAGVSKAGGPKAGGPKAGVSKAGSSRAGSPKPGGPRPDSPKPGSLKPGSTKSRGPKLAGSRPGSPQAGSGQGRSRPGGAGRGSSPR